MKLKKLLSSDKIIKIIKETLKNYIERNINDVKAIYSKNISNFKHKNKVIKEKIKNKLNNFYFENVNNNNIIININNNNNNKVVSISLDKIINTQLKYLFSEDKEFDSNSTNKVKEMILENSLFSPEKIYSVSEDLFIYVLSKNVLDESKHVLNEFTKKNIYYLMYGGAFLGCLFN